MDRLASALTLAYIVAALALALWTPCAGAQHGQPASGRISHVVVRRRHDIAGAFRDEGWLFGCVFFVLALLAAPLALVLELSFGGRGKKHEQSVIDAWHFAWLVASLWLLFQGVARAPLLSLFPLLKLCDLFHTMLMLMVHRERRSRERARPLLHLFVHYLQLVTAFACVYVAIDAAHADGLFDVQHTTPASRYSRADSATVGERTLVPIASADPYPDIAPWDALYFSVISAATVGFGDVTPRLVSGSTGATCVRAAVMAEVVLGLALLALFIPYFVSAASAPPDTP